MTDSVKQQAALIVESTDSFVASMSVFLTDYEKALRVKLAESIKGSSEEDTDAIITAIIFSSAMNTLCLMTAHSVARAIGRGMTNEEDGRTIVFSMISEAIRRKIAEGKTHDPATCPDCQHKPSKKSKPTKDRGLH